MGINGWSRCFLSQDPNNWKSLGAKIDGALMAGHAVFCHRILTIGSLCGRKQMGRREWLVTWLSFVTGS